MGKPRIRKITIAQLGSVLAGTNATANNGISPNTPCRGATRVTLALHFPATVTVASVSAVNGNSNLTRASGSFLTDGVKIGMLVTHPDVPAGLVVIAASALAVQMSGNATSGVGGTAVFGTAPVAVTPNISLAESTSEFGSEGTALCEHVSSGWTGAQTPGAGAWLYCTATPAGGVDAVFNAAFLRFRVVWAGYATVEAYIIKQFDEYEYVDQHDLMVG